MLTRLRQFGLPRAIGILVAGFAIAGGMAAWLLLMAIPERPVPIHVRWKPDVSDGRRGELEQQLHLTKGEPTEGLTWAYLLAAPSTESIRTIVQHPSVDDTEHINRVRFRPEFAYDRTRRVIFYTLLTGAAGAVMSLIQVLRRRPG